MTEHIEGVGYISLMEKFKAGKIQPEKVIQVFNDHRSSLCYNIVDENTLRIHWQNYEMKDKIHEKTRWVVL